MELIEVFRTNVNDKVHANMIIDHIHKIFTYYKANFDLQDCDRILRVKSEAGAVHSPSLIGILHEFGFSAEVLPDDQFPFVSRFNNHVKGFPHAT